MRQARLRGEGQSYYHCISRVVDRRYIFQDEEKELFVGIMRKLEAFLGLRVVTYCIMSNHFHLLVEEPDAEAIPALDRRTLLERAKYLYDDQAVRALSEELDRAAQSGSDRWLEEILDRYRQRMGSLSIFIKELKQRFTQTYNRRKGRRGTLWEDRYKSVLVEGDPQALMTIAAYIELNPVRAGMVENPEDYRWCGYASAIGGNRWAKQGLGRILDQSSKLSGEDFEKQWVRTSQVYRLWLYDQGQEREASDLRKSKPTRRGFSSEAVDREVNRGGKLGLIEVIRYRVRYFTDGAVFGSAGYVDRVFQRYRHQFGATRTTGARRMKDAEWQDLCVLRDLRGTRVG